LFFRPVLLFKEDAPDHGTPLISCQLPLGVPSRPNLILLEAQAFPFSSFSPYFFYSCTPIFDVLFFLFMFPFVEDLDPPESLSCPFSPLLPFQGLPPFKASAPLVPLIAGTASMSDTPFFLGPFFFFLFLEDFLPLFDPPPPLPRRVLMGSARGRASPSLWPPRPTKPVRMRIRS